ncbi:Agamous-like MADS-box protein AGL49 [Cardamine amara subsp. amara]|uniref:Agamous-like MADS-box protein AGL49 n=1 Tax=Cardamine amara subsp. amara TaxID=228776 RepID=A0ABD0ZT14_CARAN
MLRDCAVWVSLVNALDDQKRKIHACDLYDLPALKGLSGDELRSHLSNLDSHLLGIARQKISLIKRKYFMPKPEKETEDDDHLRVSDNNATISNPKVVSLSSEHRLGLGGVFDELGCVVRGSHETVSNLGSCYHALKVSKDVIDVLGMETDSSWLEPLLLGFSGGQQELLGGDYLGAMYDWGICSNNDGV